MSALKEEYKGSELMDAVMQDQDLREEIPQDTDLPDKDPQGPAAEDAELEIEISEEMYAQLAPILQEKYHITVENYVERCMAWVAEHPEEAKCLLVNGSSRN